MDNLERFDVALFRLINVGVKNALFDWLLPFFDSNLLFVPVLAVLAIGLIWRGGVRERLFVCFMLLTLVVGDPIIVRSMKAFIDRPRPFAVLTEIHVLVDGIDNPSMPSGHAANWFAAAVISFVYYRRSVWVMLPLAVIEAFSRVYLGVHYPSDVVAGSLIGAAYAILILGVSEALWRFTGPRWFPLWHERLPSLVNPPATRTGLLRAPFPSGPTDLALDQHWTRLGEVLIAVLLFGHFAYFAADLIELSAVEAHAWLWSKYLSLSGALGSPLHAMMQRASTWLWGNTEFGVRFFAPIAGAITAWLMLRLVKREANGFVGFMVVLVVTATPLLMAGMVLMTGATLGILFWVAAMVSGSAAVKEDSTGAWLWTGLWIGLGTLSESVVFCQWIGWGVFFLMWPPARDQLRRSGPWLGFAISLVCTLPTLAWRMRGGFSWLGEADVEMGLQPAWRTAGAEVVLLNPVFAAGLVWAVVRFWRSGGRTAFETWLFSMGVPLVVLYCGLALSGHRQPGWLAPAAIPLVALMVVYGVQRWREGAAWARHALMAGITVGWLVVVPLHDARILSKLLGGQLPAARDPLTAVLGWREMANAVDQERRDLLVEAKPVFVIGGDTAATALLAFYLPGSSAAIPGSPSVYALSDSEAREACFFLPDYEGRKGENAIYVAMAGDNPLPVPEKLHEEFASITHLGTRDVVHRNRVLHRIQVFACRDLR